MKKVKQYLNAMNQLEEHFNTEDRNYFRRLREYMTSASLFKDELAINEQLYQMHLDFLDAQDEGYSAEDFFGNDPKEMADMILEQLPKTSIKTLLEYTGIAAIIVWSIRLIFDFSNSVEVFITPALYIFDLVLVVSLIFLIFNYIQSSVYKKSSQNKFGLLEGLIAGLLLVLFIVVYLLSDRFIPNIFAFSISYPWDILIILGVSLSVILFILKTKDPNFYFLALTFVISSVIGIDKRLEVHSSLEIPFILKITILIILSFIFLYLKKKANKT